MYTNRRQTSRTVQTCAGFQAGPCVLWNNAIFCLTGHVRLPVTVLRGVRPLLGGFSIYAMVSSVSNGIMCILWLCLDHVSAEHGAGWACVRGKYSVTVTFNRCNQIVVCIRAGQDG